MKTKKSKVSPSYLKKLRANLVKARAARSANAKARRALKRAAGWEVERDGDEVRANYVQPTTEELLARDNNRLRRQVNNLRSHILGLAATITDLVQNEGVTND